MEQRHAPNVIADLSGRNIFAAFADDDGDFAFVIEISNALGERNGVARPGHFGGHFPESPLAGFLSFLGDLRDGHIGFAEPIGPHAGKMSRVIAADASNAPLRPWRVEFHVTGVEDDFGVVAIFAWAELGKADQ